MPEGREIRVLLADDHAILRAGLRKLLETEHGYRVVGEASDGAEAVRMANALSPDVVLLDVNMPHSGLLAARQLEAEATGVRVILLTAEIGDDDIVKALQFGVRGVVLKDSATEMLFRSIRTVMSGQYWLGRESVSCLIGALRKLILSGPETQKPQEKFGLTPREMEIVSKVVAGYTNKEVAQVLSISEDTVKHHLSKVYNKIGMSNRLELALFAIHHRLIEP
jgi:two-component system nitrate/nitrite response regulator NarL